jgi:AraC family transcriptional regulator, exoenzyme S synthesis regulatory protein ExsA
VLEGEKRFVSPVQDLHVKKGDILFFQRGCYSMNESIGSDYRSLVFFFEEKLLKEFVSQHLSLFETPHTTQAEAILLLQSSATFEKFIDSLLPYFHSNTPFLNQFLRLKFQEMLLHLLEIDGSQQLKSVLLNIYRGQKTELDFLMNNYYLKPLSISELAHLSGRSLSAFKRDFEERFHTSPAAWIKQRRLEHAAFLLKNSAQNVSEISMAIGYESVSHFIKAFKEKYGETPKRRK